MLISLAADDRKSAEIVRSLPDPSTPSDALLGPYCRLAFHFGASEESLRPLEDAAAPTVMKALLSLIRKHFVDIEDAATLLETMANERESEAESLYAAMRPYVVRQELDGAFSRNAERLVAHASRELDRSLKRYWQLSERVQTTQPPVQAPGPTDDPMSYAKPPSGSPVGHAHPGRDESTQKSAKETRPPADPQPMDLKLLEEILDRMLVASTDNKPNDHHTENPEYDV